MNWYRSFMSLICNDGFAVGMKCKLSIQNTGTCKKRSDAQHSVDYRLELEIRYETECSIRKVTIDQPPCR